MKRACCLPIICVTALLWNTCPAAPNRDFTGPGEVIDYPSPGDTSSSQFKVTVNGTNIFVAHFFGMHYAHLACAGVAAVAVTAAETIEQFTVSPHLLNIHATAQGDVLHFTVADTQARYLLLSINKLEHLCILIDPPEQSPPKIGDPNVVDIRHFLAGSTSTRDQAAGFANAIAAVNGTGKILLVPPGVYLTDTIAITDRRDFTLYLAPGSLIRTVTSKPGEDHRGASLSIENSRNITIAGRGVIDQQAYQDFQIPGNDYRSCAANLIFCGNSADVAIDGLTVRNARGWNYSVHDSDRFVLRNVKVITPPQCMPEWTDGINISSCHAVLVDGAFVYCNDDCFASGQYAADTDKRDSQGYVIRNLVGWNSRANGIRLGFHTTYNQNDFTFENCDFIGPAECGLYVHKLNDDPADGRFPRFGSIRLRNCCFEQSQNIRRDLIFVDRPRIGSLELIGVSFDAPGPSSIIGNPRDKIGQLTIENLVIAGRPCTDLQEASIQAQNVQNVSMR